MIHSYKNVYSYNYTLHDNHLITIHVRILDLEYVLTGVHEYSYMQWY